MSDKAQQIQSSRAAHKAAINEIAQEKAGLGLGKSSTSLIYSTNQPFSAFLGFFDKQAKSEHKIALIDQ